MNNKKIWISTLAIAAMLGVTGAVVSAQTTSLDSYIGKSKAKEVALKAVEGTVDDIDLERRAGQAYYEVEIDRANTNDEVDVHVDAQSGQVLSVLADEDKKANAPARKPAAGAATAVPSPEGSDQAKDTIPTGITKEQARTIAAQAVGGQVVKVEKDRDNGVLVYEVELRTSRGEVEVDVAVATGKVISVEYDSDDDRDDDDDDDDDCEDD